jgi:signal transduction histidine kinase/HPt (histidine-containing phosphotransfer) domain-containing protein/ActR/RegA family two-component response regulator
MKGIADGALRRLARRLARRFGLQVALTRVGAALLVVVVLAVGATVWDMRRLVLDDAWNNTDNLAVVLAEQTNRSFQTVDIVLRDVQDRISALGINTPEQFRTLLATEAVHDYLRGRVERLPQADNIALIDTRGFRVNYSVAWPAPATDLSDREHTRHFMARDDPGLFIGEPVFSQATNVWTLFLTRRVDGPNGAFLGMVVCSVPLSWFASLYQPINLSRGEIFLLARRDGTVLVRHPDPVDRAGAKLPADSPWYPQVAKGGGHFESPGAFEGLTRLVAQKLLRDYPLVMDASILKDVALEHWRRQAMLIVIGTVCAAGCLMVLLYALERQFRQLQEQAGLSARNAELTRIAAALQASEARLAATSHELETTLASMAQGLLMVDSLGTVAVCNRRAIELLDLPAGLMTARPRIDAVMSLRWLTTEFDCSAAPNRQGVVATQDNDPVQVSERTLPNGQIIEVHAGPLASGDGWMATFDDITAKRHAEQQAVFAKAESRAKSAFLAMMSHEIRTPMNGVLGLTGALFDTGLTELQRKTVAAIQDSGTSLLRILNDILDFSKLDAGQLQFEAVPFTPAVLTGDAVSVLAGEATAKGLRIKAQCEETLPTALLGDAGRLRQVLLNLVSNAIKFTEAGSVTVCAACTEADERAATMVWTVTDTGIGIPPDRIAGLFREFFQADASITRRFGGSGLGLAISKRLIEQMGGTISVESQPGNGSTFRVALRLPRTQPVPESVAVAVDVVAAFNAALHRLGRQARVLLAEDNPTNQLVVLQLLRGFDVRVDVAADGLEAVRAAEASPYDAICMDMSMPEMDGLAATRAIRAKGGDLAVMPIIALTANAFPDDIAACLAAGMNGFIAKPVSKQTLLTGLLPVFGQSLSADTPTAVPAQLHDGVDLVIDRPSLAALAEDIGEDGVAEMIAMFRDETRSRLARIAEDRLDHHVLLREVHSLKGTARAACAASLARLAADLEVRLKQGGGLSAADRSALEQAFQAWCAEVTAIEVQPA